MEAKAGIPTYWLELIFLVLVVLELSFLGIFSLPLLVLGRVLLGFTLVRLALL